MATMRFWNINDDALLAALQAAGFGAGATFAAGPEGGVAVNQNNTFIGLWVEFQRERFRFIPAGTLRPNTQGFRIEEAVWVTKQILADRV